MRPEPDKREDDRDPWRRVARRSAGTWSPWLVIRYANGDRGKRPVPPGLPYYLSPYITVRPSGLSGDPVAGQPTFVHADIFNLGSAPSAPTRVHFYWADPSLGLGEKNFTLIGTANVEIDSMYQGGGWLNVKCTEAWVPTFVNGGHECLLVQCTNRILDPRKHPFRPDLDRHVAQRNITVLEAVAGSSLNFAVYLNNPLPMQMRTAVHAKTARVTVRGHGGPELNRALVDRIAVFGQRGVSGMTDSRDEPLLERATGARATVDAQLGEESRFFRPADGEQHADGVQRGQRALRLGGVVLDGISLLPFEQRPLHTRLHIPPDSTPGEFVVFHLMQATEHVLAGGYAVVVRVVEHVI